MICVKHTLNGDLETTQECIVWEDVMEARNTDRGNGVQAKCWDFLYPTTISNLFSKASIV